MIQLEHVNLVVSDIPKMLTFYQAVFPHWYIRDEGKGEWSGKPRNWLHFGDEYQYIALSDHGEGQNRELVGHQVGLAHFAYVTHDIDGVIKRLNAVGFSIAKDGADDPYRRNVYFVDPAGFEVEFVQYLSDVPELRNQSS
ncbi:MAG: VOC family protein [Aliivibrio sp.]|uniref:VOC family protein n=1 Tax=Aliivibrio sp. TaxID=1872443 RepID=UPI001A44FEB1|nr:VOC family protein [Aliivibrio sp.]